MRVTPHKMGRCHEVTKGTAAVSGWIAEGKTKGEKRANRVRPYAPSDKASYKNQV